MTLAVPHHLAGRSDGTMIRRAMASSIVGLLFVGGCVGGRSDPAATRPATAVDPAMADAGYWLDRPATATVGHWRFQTLWDAAEDAARSRLFDIDRRDFRQGILTTEPLLSRQFWEIWRHDVVDGADLAESSLATERRTIRFEFARDDEGSYTVSPKVLIERQSLAERRITSVSQYRDVLRGSPNPTRLDDAGESIPNAYWYAIGRDAALEASLADDVRGYLRRRSGM